MEYPFYIMLIVTAIAALGFALFFNVNKRHITAATLGGVLTWALYYLLSQYMEGYFLPVMLASIFAGTYAELVAYITRSPRTVFFIISVIPLIPGRGLYYTMYYAVSANGPEFVSFAIMTLQYAAGIAVGICLVAAVVQTWDLWASEKLKRLAKIAKKAARDQMSKN